MSDRSLGSAPLLAAGHPRPSIAAVRDLGVVVVLVWAAALVVHYFDVPAALEAWNRDHSQWAIDEVTLVSLFAVAGLGVFSWRRWQESMRIIARHEATLLRLQTSEGEIAARDQLIRTVSHELRTPLTAMLGYAELLGETAPSPAERTEMITTIVRQGRDLANIVEDLLTRAQTEARTLTVAEVPVHLRANVNQVLEAWNEPERSRVLVTGEDACGVGDPARVRQIVRNLLSNAFRYGAEPVEVSIGVAEQVVSIAVSDGGRGIAAADRDRVFEPYQRLGEGPRVPGALGLGLAISRELARLMGGELAYRRVGARSVFELVLPVAPQPTRSGLVTPHDATAAGVVHR